MLLLYYCRGMASYVRVNEADVENRATRCGLVLDAVRDEANEVLYHAKRCECIAVLMELFDIWHALIKLCYVALLPRAWLQHDLVWLPAFFLSGIVPAIKHARRYRYSGCIRSDLHCTIASSGTANHACTRRK